MKRTYLVTLILMTGILGNSCSDKTVSTTTVTKEKIYVKTTHARMDEYIPELEMAGTVKPLQEANLGVVLPGRVEKYFVKEGDFVKKNQLLVQLSNELLVQAKIENKTLNKDFDRVRHLYEKGSLPEQKYDHVKAQYEASSAKCEMLRKNTEIRAPFSGLIEKYLVQEGENYLVAPNLDPGYSMTSGIVRIIDINKVLVEVEINEKDLSSVKLGYDATILCSALDNLELSGKVTIINPSLNTLSRTATVAIEIENSSHELKPGMYCQVTIQLPTQQAVFIPMESIVLQSGTADRYVFAVKNNTAHRIPITEIASIGNRVAVTGLDVGTEIITVGKRKLENGSRITVKN